jgi:hypothetical protein
LLLRRIYDLRHSFATWALAAGLSIFELARYMGTSVDMIDRTYGHLARGSEDLARAKLDAHAASDLGSFGPGSGHALEIFATGENESPAFAGLSCHGRYWARTSDPQLVELVLSQLS